MKGMKAIVKFFMTKSNMEYLLKGISISNFDDVRTNLFKDISNKLLLHIYEPRSNDPNHPDNKVNYEGSYHLSEYPDDSDRIVAKVLRYIRDNKGDDYLEIEIIDSLYFSKLNQPVIKINGYYELSDGAIKIKKVSRLTLADRNC